MIKWSSTIGWMFLADNTAAGATRIEQVWQIDLTGVTVPTFVGWVTLTLPTANAHAITGHAVDYATYTTGTASCATSTVTGTGTSWQTNKIQVGSRIAFGYTDPTLVPSNAWHNITAVGAETTITIADTATAADGVYVIEELMIYLASKNTTTTSSGLFVIKGLNIGDFTNAGSTIPAATTVDNIKACYWLKDASTETNTYPIGLAMEPRTSRFAQTITILDSNATTNVTVYQYNGRNALSNLSSGADYTTAGINILKTGSQTGLTGNTALVDNVCMATTVAGHGAGNGAKSIYFVTVTRWYRILASGPNFVNAGTNFISDLTTEVPPGGVNIIAASGAMASVDYIPQLDAFLLQTSSATGFRSYVTKYWNDGTRFNKIFGTDDKQLDQQSAFNEGGIIHPTTQNLYQTSGVDPDGRVMFAGTGTTALTNIGRIVPLGADAIFQIPANGIVPTSAQVVIAPVMTTAGAQTFSRAFMNNLEQAGHLITEGLGIPCEAIYTYYRTTGISDNSGAWTKVGDNDDLSSVAGAGSIQFLFAFRCIGLSSVPSRIYCVGVTYNDFTSLANYVFSANFSSAANKQFAFYFKTAYGGTLPPLRIVIKDTDAGTTLVDDNTTSPTGTWEKSTDGGSNWVAWTNADRANATTYLRYTPASISDNVKATPTLGLL